MKLVCLLLAALVAATFAPVLSNGFLTYDDYGYILDNPFVNRGLSPEGARWAFTSIFNANWQPLTWLSYMTDVSLFGLDPRGHHLTSLLFHIANTLLLFGALRALTGALAAPALAAALFAVHPLHVESVAWATEKKDMVSTFFLFLTLHAYVAYVRRGGALRYSLVALSLSLGLMAKAMLATLPAALLLLDVWPLGRLRPALPTGDAVATVRRAILEKIPLFLLSAASIAVTSLALREYDMLDPLSRTPLGERLANAVAAAAGYLAKTAWPAGLAVYYPGPPGRPLPETLLLAALLLALSVGSVAALRRRPWLATGWFWYLGTLVPVSGIVQHGDNYLGDRFTYVPLTGIFIALAWSAAEAVRSRPALRAAVTVAALGAVLALAVAANLQARLWRNDLTLFSDALRVTTGNHVAHGALGDALGQAGRHEEAIPHLREAIRIKPRAKDLHYNLGNSLMGLYRFQEAAEAYREAIRIDPRHARASNNLGNSLSSLGSRAEAVEAYRRAVSLDPAYAEAYVNLGNEYRALGLAREGVLALEQAVRLEPRLAAARSSLALAYQAAGDREAAAAQYRALRELR